MTTSLGLLTRNQSILVDNFSQPVLRESTDIDQTSSDEELSDWRHEDIELIKSMTHSHNAADKRFISIFKLKRAH